MSRRRIQSGESTCANDLDVVARISPSLGELVATRARVGKHETTDAVIRAALKALSREETSERAKRRRWAQSIELGIASGIFVGDAFESVRAELGLTGLRVSGCGFSNFARRDVLQIAQDILLEQGRDEAEYYLHQLRLYTVSASWLETDSALHRLIDSKRGIWSTRYREHVCYFRRLNVPRIFLLRVLPAHQLPVSELNKPK